MMQANCQTIEDRLIHVCILFPEHVDNINKLARDILCFLMKQDQTIEETL